AHYPVASQDLRAAGDLHRHAADDVLEEVDQRVLQLLALDGQQLLEKPLDGLHDEAQDEDDHDHGDHVVERVAIEHRSSPLRAKECRRRGFFLPRRHASKWKSRSNSSPTGTLRPTTFDAPRAIRLAMLIVASALA